MMWLTWRQFRAQGIVAAALAVALGVVLLITGLNLAHLNSDSGGATCHGARACATAANAFINQLPGTGSVPVFFGTIAVIYLAPALMGIFWGAPLVARELETGTFRLAWNQSVSRARWLVVKLGVVGLAAMATAGLLSLFLGWWESPIFRAAALAGSDSAAVTRISPQLFGAQGIAPIGYAAFAFALGVTAGALIRRTIPAMAVTLAAFGLVQAAWPLWIRSHLITPLREYFAITPANVNELAIINNTQMIVRHDVEKPGAWVVSDQTVSPSGHLFSGPPTHACLSANASPNACNASIAALHLRALISYEPASRFWPLQWTETGIFVVLAMALAAFCAWRIGKRRLA